MSPGHAQVIALAPEYICLKMVMLNRTVNKPQANIGSRVVFGQERAPASFAALSVAVAWFALTVWCGLPTMMPRLDR